MKTLRFFLLLSLSVIIFSCNKDDSNGKDAAAVSDIVKSGTWRITYFMYSGEDKTTDYAGYTLTFDPGGILLSAKDGNDLTGVWSTIDRADGDNCDMVLSFITADIISRVSNRWHVIWIEPALLRMADDDGSGDATFLYIEKN